MFLPNAYSFLLIRRQNVGSDFSSATETATAVISPGQPVAKSSSAINDGDKRTFLKVVSVAGAGIAAATLLPNKAHALIMGSSPTTGVVGVKNAANTRINPATEETVSTLLKSTDSVFDAGALKVKVTAVSGDGSGGFSTSANETTKSALVDAARHVQVDVLSSALPTTASTETTLTTINYGGKQFALKMTTVGSIDYVAEADTGTAFATPEWRVKKVDSTTGIVITWADGDEEFNNSATDLTTLTYL